MVVPEVGKCMLNLRGVVVVDQHPLDWISGAKDIDPVERQCLVDQQLTFLVRVADVINHITDFKELFELRQCWTSRILGKQYPLVRNDREVLATPDLVALAGFRNVVGKVVIRFRLLIGVAGQPNAVVVAANDVSSRVLIVTAWQHVQHGLDQRSLLSYQENLFICRHEYLSLRGGQCCPVGACLLGSVACGYSVEYIPYKII
ncbi:hypothetical protein D3C77_210100 [compost metagenome]